MQDQRDLGTFEFPPHIRMKLKSSGFSVVGDLSHMKPTEIAKELKIGNEEALGILQTVKQNKNINQPITALHMLQKDAERPTHITLFCQELDEMLGGGIPVSKITELCGAPGVGKTQMCMQLCVTAQIPEVLGGMDGEAVFIDTEGSFIPQRAMDMASSAHEHCKRILKDKKDQESVLVDFSPEKILSKVHYFRCSDYVELLAVVNLMINFLKEHPKVKLIVIDSVAFHFRHDFEDLSLRTRLLNGMAQNLIRIAVKHDLAVVLTNQMTTKVKTQVTQSHLVPALGQSWGHAPTNRVILFWQNNQRLATLYKSPNMKEMTVPYFVTRAGIRSANSTNTTAEAGSSSSDDAEAVNPSKRQKLDQG